MAQFIIPALIFSFILLVVLLGLYNSPKNVVLREVKKIRRKSIHSVRTNEYAKIVGKAKHAGTPLIAPLSKRKCVYYDIKVKEKRGKHWKTIINDVQFQDFFIQAGTENAVIHLNKVRAGEKRIHLVADHKLNSGFFKSADVQTEQFLKLYGKDSKGTFGLNRTLRYTERIIELDEEIAVIGIGSWINLDTPIDGYSDSRVLALSGTRKQKLVLTDEPKAMERVKRKL